MATKKAKRLSKGKKLESEKSPTRLLIGSQTGGAGSGK